MNTPFSGKIFEHRSIISASLQAVQDFHEQSESLSRLTPFPIIVQLIRDERLSLIEGELEFRLWLGQIPIRWVASHESINNEQEGFCDKMIAGPMMLWEHKHIFKENNEGIELIDQISLAHHSGWRGWLTRLLFDGLSLRFLFYYRHWQTKRAIS